MFDRIHLWSHLVLGFCLLEDFFFFFFLVVPGLSCGMWTLSCDMHVGSSFLTRDRTWAPCIGSAESYPLHHQGSPMLEDFSSQFQFQCLWLVCLCFLFLPGSVLEGCAFLRIFPFLPGFPFYWHIVACSNLSWFFVVLQGHLAALGLCCGARASHCTGLPCWGAWASAVVAHRLSCSAACGIFLDQGLNPCPLNWQVDS